MMCYIDESNGNVTIQVINIQSNIREGASIITSWHSSSTMCTIRSVEIGFFQISEEAAFSLKVVKVDIDMY